MWYECNSAGVLVVSLNAGCYHKKFHWNKSIDYLKEVAGELCAASEQETYHFLFIHTFKPDKEIITVSFLIDAHKL